MQVVSYEMLSCGAGCESREGKAYPFQLAVGVLIHQASQAAHVHAPNVGNGQQGIDQVVEGAACAGWGGACIQYKLV